MFSIRILSALLVCAIAGLSYGCRSTTSASWEQGAVDLSGVRMEMDGYDQEKPWRGAVAAKGGALNKARFMWTGEALYGQLETYEKLPQEAGARLRVTIRSGERTVRLYLAPQPNDDVPLRLAEVTLQRGAEAIPKPMPTGRIDFASVTCLTCGDPWFSEFRMPWPVLTDAAAPNRFTVAVDRLVPERQTEPLEVTRE